jgi:hypothetical protein
MRGPKPKPLTLSEVERRELKALVRRHSTPQQVALRARIILAADAGKNNSQIAREEEVSVDTSARLAQPLAGVAGDRAL